MRGPVLPPTPDGVLLADLRRRSSTAPEADQRPHWGELLHQVSVEFALLGELVREDERLGTRKRLWGITYSETNAFRCAWSWGGGGAYSHGAPRLVGQQSSSLASSRRSSTAKCGPIAVQRVLLAGSWVVHELPHRLQGRARGCHRATLRASHPEGLEVLEGAGVRQSLRGPRALASSEQLWRGAIAVAAQFWEASRQGVGAGHALEPTPELQNDKHECELCMHVAMQKAGRLTPQHG